MNANVKKAKDAGIDALAIVGGLILGKYAMDFAQGKVPAMAVPALGLLGLAPHFTDIGGEIGKQVGNGLLAAGAIQGVKNFTSGKTGLLATVNSAFPALSGFSGYAGLAGYADDFQNNLGAIAPEPVQADMQTLLFS